MIDISVKNLDKNFGETQILKNLSFEIYEGEKVGLLGKNGAGKTTLFKIISGELTYEAGTVTVRQTKKTGTLSQIPVYPAGFSVEDVLKHAFSELFSVKDELHRLEKQMETDHSKKMLDRYGELSARFEAAGGYAAETEINKVASGLSIDAKMRLQEFDTLSGGEKTRVNLARMILEKTDILLLDEPTNHLDMSAVLWLEEFLLKYKGTVLIISHDRYFLDRIIKKTIELIDASIEFYDGNYSFYVREKEARYVERLKAYEKEQHKIKQLEESARRLHTWAQGHDNPKLHKRAKDIERRIARIGKSERPKNEKSMRNRFGEDMFRGDDVLKIKGLTKAFEDKILLEDITLEVAADEHIALIGDNGTGKSTLVKILLGHETPDTGSIKLGANIKTAYLPQIVEFPHEERTLIDTLIYEQDCAPQTARNRLAAFKFIGDDVFKTVSKLSGGERSRLKLCMLMNEQINFLILDEPTNHLDIASREWIEEALAEYGGTLLFISHDRYFVNKFAERIWALKDKKIFDFRGDYEDYRFYTEKQVISKTDVNIVRPKKSGKAEKRTEKLRISELERLIDETERELAEIEFAMEAAATEFEILNELYDKKYSLSEKRDMLYNEWDELIGSQSEN